jgi:two-component system, NarL family, nitrate/nitrite response regulator NarL
LHHTICQQLMKIDKPNATIKILVADDHPSTVESIVRYVKASDDFEIICVVGTFRDALNQLKSQKFDVAVLDLFLPRNRPSEYSQLAGYEILDFIKEHNIDILPIIFSSHEEPGYIMKAKAKGAKGYLSKKIEAAEFREAIRTVVWQEKEYIEKNLLTKIIMIENPDGIILTQRERSILNYISEGLTSREIGDKLNLANDTVRDYRDSLIKKFGAKNSVNLIRIAAENGYLTQP